MPTKIKNKRNRKKPGVSVIIPFHNSENTIKDTIKSIASSSYIPSEVILVDDCSTDNSLKKAREIEGLKFSIIALNKNKGAAYARNRGAEKARGDILLFVDSDVIIEKDTIKKMISPYSSGNYDSVIGVYGKKLAYKNLSSVYKNIFLFYQQKSNYLRFWSGCGSIKKDVFIRIGGFDDSIKGAIYEDTLLGHNLMSKGYKIYVNHDCKVIHNHKYTFFSVMKNDYNKSKGWSFILNEKRIRNRYYLNPSNLFSMAFSIIFLPLILLSFVIRWSAIIALSCFVLVLLINLDFYNEINKKSNLSYGFLSVLIHISSYIVAFFGGLRGTIKKWAF